MSEHTEKRQPTLAVQVFIPKVTFDNTAVGKRYQDKLLSMLLNGVRDRVNATYKKKEAYLQKKSALKSAKWGWLVGGWCAE